MAADDFQARIYQLSARVTAEERELWIAAAGEGSIANWLRTTLTEIAQALVKAKPYLGRA